MICKGMGLSNKVYLRDITSRSEGRLLKGLRNDRKKDYFVGIVLSTLLCAVSVSAPIVGFFCFLLLPLPIIFYRVKLGRKSSGIIFLSSFLLVAFLAGGFAVDIFFLLGIMGLGFLIGEGIYNNLPVEKNILYASGVILFAAACSLIIYGNIIKHRPIGVVSDYIGKNIALTISLYKEMGMPDETIRMLTEAENEIRHILIRIFPALVYGRPFGYCMGQFSIGPADIEKKRHSHFHGSAVKYLESAGMDGVGNCRINWRPTDTKRPNKDCRFKWVDHIHDHIFFSRNCHYFFLS